MSRPPAVALFVTGHGYGHAARACALMQELYGLRPDIRLHVFGELPRWFLEESLEGLRWRLHPSITDAGPVQATALQLDLAATRARLRERIPLAGAVVERAADLLREIGASVVICDIAALGLLAGVRVGVPTVLVENFTWDWIYRRLEDRQGAAPGARDEILVRAADWLEGVYTGVDLRIQTRPWCAPVDGALRVGALARAPRRGRRQTRAALGIGPGEVMALLSMGGVPWRYQGLDDRGLDAAVSRGLRAVIVGEAGGPLPAGAVLLPHHSRFHHPDLVAAADVVVGKLGYSTLAEAWQAACAFAYVERADFPEIPVLEEHAREVMPAVRLSAERLQDGTWVEAALAVAARPAPRIPYENGRPRAARAVAALL